MRKRGAATNDPQGGPAALRLVHPPDAPRALDLGSLRRREPAAVGAFFDDNVERVERLLMSVLGPDAELSDLVQQTFLAALRSFPAFRGEAWSLAPWLNRIAVHTARRHIRSRRVRRWLRFAAPGDVPDVPSAVASPAIRAALGRVYSILEHMPADERIALSLRFVGQLELTELAEATGVSLATAKRCLGRARDRFLDLARRDAVLRGWLEEKDDGL
ncbi:MAG: sigma-70 family RNA polymerase sigma factor [Deltaproteobacteria bacterium]|nr:sigma-70 family RNA polymerase sigma factor [Deltaproteobacteria bacterium]